MAYSKLNLKNGTKLNQDHLAHIEAGIVANEAELANKALKSDISGLQPKGDYALKSDIPASPDLSGYVTDEEFLEAINNIKTSGEVSDEAVASAVATWLTNNPEVTTTVQDSSISYDKLNDMLRSAVDMAGMQSIEWTIGKKLTPTTDANHTYGITSNMIYLKAGEKFEVLDTIAFRYAYYGIDGSTYDATNSGLSAWTRATLEIPLEGFYRFWVEFSPTSTTVITKDNLSELLSKFSIKPTTIFGLHGSNIQNESIPLSKLGEDIFTPILTHDSILRQSTLGGINFGKGIVPSADNKGIKKEKFTTLLADTYSMSVATDPSSKVTYGVTLPNGSDITSSSRADICIVKDELWVFGVAADDNSNYGTVWRLKYDPITNTLREIPKFFWHNWGHCNAVNYNPVTDCLILGNGSADYNLTNAVYIIHNVTDILNSESGAIIDFNTHGVKIDMSGYDFGAKLNVFWTNTKTITSNYTMTKEYLPNTAFAYADDVNKAYIIAFGTGTNQYPYGTYTEPTGDSIWNGTYSILSTYQLGDENEVIGNPGSYEHCGQGGDAIEGTAFVGLGHNPFWWTELTPTSASTMNKADKYFPSFNYETGQLANDKVEGIAVTNDYLIIMATGNINYIPR